MNKSNKYSAAFDEDDNINDIEYANAVMSSYKKAMDDEAYPGQARRDNMSNPGDKDYDT